MLKNLFFLIPLILCCFFAHTICFDLQSAISEEAKDVEERRIFFEKQKRNAFSEHDSPSFDLYNYHSHDEILSYIKSLSEQNPQFVQLGSMGKSFEGRDLAYLKIGYPSNKVKRAMLVDAGFHAREWISHATVLNFVHQLVNDSRLKPLLEEIDIFVVPAVNPDGYEYSRKVDREWRETRSGPYGPNKCFGVDPNRNFDYHWGTTGISHEPCDNGQYCGPKPFSEPETYGLANLLRDVGESLTAYITLHSYAGVIIYPYGDQQNSYPSDVDDLKNLAEKANSAIVEAGGPQYKIGTAYETLGYVCSGASDDWSKNLGIKYVFTIELESLGTGFVVPPKFIQPVAAHTIPALLVIADAVKDYNNTE